MWLIGCSLALRKLLRVPAGFSDEARQLNQQAAGYSERIVLPLEGVHEFVKEFLGTRTGGSDHLIGQVSHKIAANVETSPPTTSSEKPASLAAFRSAAGAVWDISGDRRDSFVAASEA